MNIGEKVIPMWCIPSHKFFNPFIFFFTVVARDYSSFSTEFVSVLNFL